MACMLELGGAPDPNACKKCERVKVTNAIGFSRCLKCDRSEVQVTYPSARKTTKEDNKRLAWRAARGLP